MNTRFCSLALAGAALCAAVGLRPVSAGGEKPAPKFRTLLAPGASAGETPPEGRPLKIAVLDFFERTPYTKTQGSLGHQTAVSVAQELDKTGRFDVYSREDLEATMSELRIENGSLVSEQTAARIGKQADVDYVIYGDI